jgi:hypothetical protein
MRAQLLIAVTDVEASSGWYQRLLGCRSNHGGRAYEQLGNSAALFPNKLRKVDASLFHNPLWKDGRRSRSKSESKHTAVNRG